MSRDAVNRVIELAPRLGLTHLEFRVLLYLADRLNARTGQLNPSPARLAHDCGLDAKTGEAGIRRVLQRLVRKGLLDEDPGHRGGRLPGGRYPTKRYRLRVAATAPLRGDATAPLNSGVRVAVTAGEGGRHGRVRVAATAPEPRKLEPEKKNLPGGSTTRPDVDNLCVVCGLPTLSRDQRGQPLHPRCPNEQGRQPA